MVRRLKLDRVLAVSPSTPAEVVLIGPALRSLRHGCPSAVIHLAVPPRMAPVAKMLPFFDKLVEIPHLSRPEYGLALESGPYDAAIIFTGEGRSPYPDAYGCYLAGVPVRVGLSSEFGGSILSHWVRPVPGAHPVERHLALVTSIGVPATERRLELNVPSRLRALVNEKLSRLGLETEKHLVLVRCREALGLRIANTLLRGGRTKAVAEAAPYLLLGLDTRVAARIDRPRRETVECAFAARSSLAITDDPATAYLSEAVNCPVLFIESSGQDKGPLPRYATINGTGVVCQQDSPTTIVGQAFRMLESPVGNLC